VIFFFYIYYYQSRTYFHPSGQKVPRVSKLFDGDGFELPGSMQINQVLRPLSIVRVETESVDAKTSNEKKSKPPTPPLFSSLPSTVEAAAIADGPVKQPRKVCLASKLCLRCMLELNIASFYCGGVSLFLFLCLFYCHFIRRNPKKLPRRPSR
jgi:hypothetical protein